MHKGNYSTIPSTGDYDILLCRRCERNGEECVHGRTRIKFMHGSSARYDLGFSKDQTWMRTAGRASMYLPSSDLADSHEPLFVLISLRAL